MTETLYTRIALGVSNGERQALFYATSKKWTAHTRETIVWIREKMYAPDTYEIATNSSDGVITIITNKETIKAFCDWVGIDIEQQFIEPVTGDRFYRAAPGRMEERKYDPQTAKFISY